MQKNHLPITAAVLIVVGVAGLLSTTWFGGPSAFSGGMYMMMGGGMMGRDGMREMMQEMMSGRLPPGIKPGDLPEPESAGANVLTRYCAQCHHLPNPAMHTAEDWLRVEDRMVARERMMASMHGMGGGMMMRGMMTIRAPSVEDERVLLAYLQRHALKPASLETLGAPGTPGLDLFRRTCSQCHALPDPQLHTPDEWPSVVERMRKNMDTMGKPVITDQEREEIVGFLKQKAR